MKTTRITVETETLMIVQRAKTTSTWCPDCRAEVDVILLDKDNLTELATEAQIQKWLVSGQLHLWQAPNGPVQICVSSLMQCLHFEQVQIAVSKNAL